MTTFTLPFTVLTLASYLQSIPIEVEEQALIDGCGRVDILFRIILPLAAPAIVAISMYSFVFSWNEYLYVVVLVGSEDLFTLPVGIASLLTSDIIPWGKMLAMSVLYAIPGMAFFAFLQKYLIAGLTKGALKY
jgi:multiple sugar transport system permease protein